MIKILPIILILSFLFSCGSQNEQKSDNNLKDTSKIKNDTSVIAATDYFKIEGDSLLIPPVEIEVSLSEKTNQKLKKDKETIIVAAFFSGKPKDTTSEMYLQNGEINVAYSEKELSDSRVAKFEGVKFSKGLYDSLADKDIQLLINIYSGRRSTNLNLLDCNILQDKMSVLKGKKFVLKGKLIGEPDSIN